MFNTNCHIFCKELAYQFQTNLFFVQLWLKSIHSVVSPIVLVEFGEWLIGFHFTYVHSFTHLKIDNTTGTSHYASTWPTIVRLSHPVREALTQTRGSCRTLQFGGNGDHMAYRGVIRQYSGSNGSVCVVGGEDGEPMHLSLVKHTLGYL